MGLLDILNGMQNGPRGGHDAREQGGEKGGMSPITMAILALLAYKAMKHVGGGQGTATPAPVPAPGGQASSGGLGGILGSVLGGMMNGPRGGGSTGGGAISGGAGGGLGGGDLGDLLKGGLGGLLAGGAAGSVLSGGLDDLLKQFQQSGQAEAADSWVGRGENKTIAPKDLASALGADQIGVMMQQSGLSRDDLLAGLSQMLPQAIDQMTPEGRLPTAQEASRMI